MDHREGRREFVLRKPHDWVAAWFPLMDALGEDTRIPFGRYDPATCSIEWVRIPHEEVDGVGGLTRLLSARGWQIGPLPQKQETPPSRWKFLVSFLRYQTLVRARSTAWRVYDYAKRGPTSGILWRVFTREETEELQTQAARSEASLNSFLLSALNDASTSLFLRPNATSALWWIPVNMRGLTKNTDATSNHSSYIGVELSPGMPPRDVHAAIKTQLTRRMHWGAWMGIHIGAIIGVRGMYWIMRYYEKKQNCWMGTFTNLGDWPPPGYAPPPKGDPHGWTVSSTVTVAHPIGAACMIWDGQLSLTLQIHPALNPTPDVARELFDTWTDRVTLGVSPRERLG